MGRVENPALVVAIACFCALATSAAFAQIVPPAAGEIAQASPAPIDERPRSADGKSPDDWRFGVTIYGWGTSLSGSATARGQMADINASVIQLFQKSDSLGALDGYFEANKGRFGLYGDVVWAKLQIPATAAAYRNPVAGLKPSVQANAAITTSLTILESGGLFELARWPGSGRSFAALDVLAGVRYWNISTSIAADVQSTLDFSRIHLDRFDQSRNVGYFDSGSLNWVDPLIGARLRHQFTPSQQVFLEGDIGGFGIPGSSLFSWNVVGVYSYTWQFDGYALAAVVGYRALSTNISFNNGLDASGLNLVIHGPLVGATLKF
jgi:hypothetical protein